jgi:hypothetical protein
MSDDAGGMRGGARAVAVVSGAVLLALAWSLACPPGCDEQEKRASILQAEGGPVAVITPLPDAVSNGTTYVLSASSSYDTDNGTLIKFAWEIVYGDQVEYLYAVEQPYKFRVTGLYKIKLTVTDNFGMSGVNFTAVYSVPDSDIDGMPDWWETKYFNGLSAQPTGDPDDDGYTNIEEFVHDTNPLVPDPGEGLVEENWQWILLGGTIAVIAFIIVYPIRRRRKKEGERKKMELAVEIQKALEED